jgi:hypothetical protein
MQVALILPKIVSSRYYSFGNKVAANGKKEDINGVSLKE